MADRRPVRVLVVDDEAAMRDIVRRYLTADGAVAEALTKLFSPRALEARVRAVLRRRRDPDADSRHTPSGSG